MATPLLTTKLYIPPVRPKLVPRPRLIERLNEGPRSRRKLTLVSAPAGFGKTTLVSEWVAGCGRPAAWLSLDEGDNDPTRFLTYLVAALQTIAANIGEEVLHVLHASQPQPPPIESILTALINEITTIPDNIVLVLDDYHVIDAKPVDDALSFTLDHLPPQMHLVIATRIDPALPLSRLRAGGQMTEIREADLRFSADESNTFLGTVMGLNLSAENVAALETRTEGWIAGLQLAALSMQGLKKSGDIADFIDRFTGSDRYIQDYLADEVLRQRPKGTKDFLLQTSILNRLYGPLCDAVRFGLAETPYHSEGEASSERIAVCEASFSDTEQKNSQAILEALEAASLFIVPLDNERRWYRYHHLFADLLRQRLHQQQPDSVAELHSRASVWYEDNGLEIEAFHHAAAANDVERAERLLEGEGLPLQFRGAAAPVLNWLESLPTTVLDARPSLWVTWASALVFAAQASGVEQKLQAAEAALQHAETDDKTQDLVGHIAALRAMMAVNQHHVETIIAQSRRALELLHPDNLTFRTATTWTLGYAYELQGDHASASRAYTEVISNSQASGNFMFTIAATTSLGNIQEAENQLYLAAQTHKRALQLAGDPPLPFACASYLGLARVLYEWNDLDGAQQHGQQSAKLARQIEGVDTPAACGVFLARLKLARGDVAGAVAILAEADQFVRQHNFAFRMPDVAAAQVLTMLREGKLAAAAHLAEKHELPISQARVHLAQGDTAAALAILEPMRRHAEAKGLADERLKVMVLQALARHAHGEKGKAVQLLGDALALAEPGGIIRIFVDEGIAMAQLLSEAASRGIVPDYTRKLLAAFEAEGQKSKDKLHLSPSSPLPGVQPLIEPLTPREREVLQLIAIGRSNPEIAAQLVIAVTTVKTHVRNIYGKLQVTSRFQAVARARDLNLV
jgi:LuxR family maltose regulon positive regulatory protein